MSSLLFLVVGLLAVAAVASISGTARTAPDTDQLAPVGALTSLGTDTVFPVRKPDGWQVRTLDSLADVEAFLDYLEHNRVTEREMIILANNSFAVRWRAA
jgi:hypothetical protein